VRCITRPLRPSNHVSPIPDDDNDVARRERAIQSLTEDADASPEKVRGLFAREFARLERGAKVRKYLHVLTASRVRAQLRRTDAARRTK
jgi:Protein of unknown function (DUF3562)